MRRIIDWTCSCGYERLNVLADENEQSACPRCAGVLTQRWWGTRSHDAQWSDRDAIMVHVTDDPSVPADCRVRYVGSHDARLKPGYRREYLRNLQEVNRFEREHQVMNHRLHYDSNGRDITDNQNG